MSYLWKVQRQADSGERLTETVSQPSSSWDYAFYRLIQAISKDYRNVIALKNALQAEVDPAIHTEYANAVSIAALTSTTVHFGAYTYWISHTL